MEIFCLLRVYQGAKQKGHGTPSAYVFIIICNQKWSKLSTHIPPDPIFVSLGHRVKSLRSVTPLHRIVFSLNQQRRGIPAYWPVIPPQHDTLSFCLASKQQFAANLDYFLKLFANDSFGKSPSLRSELYFKKTFVKSKVTFCLGK
jgi:hypothetical protein